MNEQRSRARSLALKIISGVVFLLVWAGFMSDPKSRDAGRSRPDPD